MKFKESKSIYLQIADRINDEILQGQYAEEGRIPSVREYAATVEVNANTVVRTYDYLQGQEIIYNKRGIGYFVSAGAKDRIITLRKDIFLHEELPEFFRQVSALDIPIKEIEKMILVSDIGITPTNDGKVIRLIFPELTEDRRKEIVKDIKKKGENAKVAVRNVRRDANDFFKKQNKDNIISEDEYKNIEEDVQKLTDKYIAEIDKAVEAKSKEILTV
mgnify:CR=1 FL=1